MKALDKEKTVMDRIGCPVPQSMVDGTFYKKYFTNHETDVMWKKILRETTRRLK